MKELKFRAQCLENGEWEYFGLSEVGSIGVPLAKIADNIWQHQITGKMFTNLEQL